MSRKLTFANWVWKVANIVEGVSWIQIRNLISQKRFLQFKTKSLIWPLLMAIKLYWILFWQCSCPNLIFRKRHFQELATKSQKHVLVKISSTKMSYNIYNIYNRHLRNDARSIFRERETETHTQRETHRERHTQRESREREREILATFHINILFLVFYVNIQPSCSKTKREYFNIKIRPLIRET